MPVDHANRLLFVHIPKTGGTSVLTLLGLWAADRAPNFQTLFGDFGELDLQHMTLRQLRQFLTPAEYREYYKFSFVRNPWDRTVSSAFWHARFQEEGIRDLRDYVEFAERVNTQPDPRGHDVHALPQLAFLFNDAGQVGVDRIGRFENYEEDLRGILAPRIEINAPLPHKLRREDRRNYRDYYTGDLARRVKVLYLDDIVRFGYRF